MSVPTYEEQFGPVARRMRRLARAARRGAKRVAGRPLDILVEIRWRLGDEIMAIPIYEALRTRHPGCGLTVWCTYPELLEESPFVDAVNVPVAAPDIYIHLRGAPRDVYRLKHYARQAGTPLPFARPRLYCETWTSPLLDQLPPRGTLRVAVTAGATWPTKRWQLEHWRRLCRDLIAQGVSLVELGRGVEAIGLGTCLVDRTSVRDAACVLRAVDMLICSDSGLMHLALAVGTPVLALFGPTDPSILIRNEPKLTIMTNDRECQGCWNGSQQMTRPGVCPRQVAECLGTITPDAVRTRLGQLVRIGA